MLEVYPLTDPASKAEFVSLFDNITRTDRRKSTDTTVRGNITKSHWLDSDLASSLDDDLLPALEEQVVKPALRQWRAYAHRQLVEFARPAVSRYAERRRESGQLTFQDLLVHTRRLLRNNPNARQALQSQYPRLLVDEFQDTDPIQAELLFYLASRDPSTEDWTKCRPRDGSLFIVGDDKQSIYRFRRADLDVYTEVRQAIDRAPNGEDVTLESNFRSAPPLLSWCNDTFDEVFGQLDAPYQAQYVPFAAARTDAPTDNPVLQLEVPYVKGASSTRKIARRNADQVARLVAAACREDTQDTPLVGTSPGDFMVLTRNTTRLDEFAEAFAEQGLPYTLAGGDDVKTSSELYALVTLLTCIERPGDPVARLAYLRGPLVGLSDDALYRYRRAGGQFDGPFHLPADLRDALAPTLAQQLEQSYAHLRHAQEHLESLRPAAALERILDRLGLLARTRRDLGMGSLHAGRLLRVLTKVQRLDAEGHTWTEVRDELQQILDGDRSLDGLTLETGAADAVRLLNVHKAKGLEAPVVFLADPYGGTHPKSPTEHVRRDEGDVVLPVYEKHRYHRSLRFAPERWAAEFEETEAQYQRAEEDRLLYVAATRAEEQVVLSRYRSPSWSKEKGYWAPLYDFLETVPTVDPSDAPASSRERQDTLPDVVGPEDWDAIEAPTYQTTTVTDTPQEKWRPTLGDGYGSRFGTALHRLFEYTIQRRDAPLSPIERSSVIDVILSKHEATEHRDIAQRMLEAFLGSPLWKSIRAAEIVHTEFPVAGLDAAKCPTITEGTIDLLYRDENHWHLVDFKSDRVDEEDVPSIRERYRDQLRHYAALWTDATNRPLADLSLWLAHLGRPVSVEWDPSP
jgi:ATP-dependent helicase/nuclease subunit A